MRILRTDDATEWITELKNMSGNDKIRLSFSWPKHIEQIYIFKVGSDFGFDIEKADLGQAVMYTLDEYKTFHGYVEDVVEVNQFVYYLFPFKKNRDEIVVYVQNNEQNQILVNSGQVEILYTICEKKKLFSDEKAVSIAITPNGVVSKDLLCYVVKKGGYPSNIDDGMAYEFLEDFPPQETVLPSFLIKKDEYVGIFLCSPSKHKNIYILKNY